MNEKQPEQNLSIQNAESQHQAELERSAGNKKLSRTVRGVAAATAAVAFFLPNPDAGDVSERSDLIEHQANQEPNIETATPTPGYERGRAEEVTE